MTKNDLGDARVGDRLVYSFFLKNKHSLKQNNVYIVTEMNNGYVVIGDVEFSITMFTICFRFPTEKELESFVKYGNETALIMQDL